MKRKKTGLIIWVSVSAFLVALLIVVNVLTTTVFYSFVNLVLNGPRPIFAEGVEEYYTTEYEDKDEVYAAARNFNVKLAEEGMVLLKNRKSALPIKTPVSDSRLKVKPRVSVFGKNSVDIAYGGSGSGGNDGESAVDLYKALESAGYEYNKVLKRFYENTGLSGAKRETSGNDLDSGDTVILSTAETPQSSYTDEVKNSYKVYNDAAIIVITRVGGEGMDLPRTMKGSTGYINEDDHFLQLDKNETELIQAVCEQRFKKVIVLLNVSAAMEVGFLKDPDHYAYNKKIDAAIWMGYPGDTGLIGLCNILNGTVSPSGHTVDTFVYDLKRDPTWNNFGDNLITGNPTKGIVGGDEYCIDGDPELYYFVDYEEGVYVGYRYYETRGAQDEEWYKQAVVYPFGHGLSYTSFDWEIVKSIEGITVDQNKEYKIKVKVTNKGKYAGKDVVQLYAHAPYLGGIEKPEEVLVAFAKTDMLKPGKSQTVELSFNPYYLASYDYKDKNDNGFYGYELEAGDGYCLYLSHDAHDKEFTIPFFVPDEGIQYVADPVTGKEVVNRYTDMQDEAFNSDTQLSTVLSRSDWQSTWPTAPDDEERNVTAEFISLLADVSHNNPTDFDELDMPWTDEPADMDLRDLLFDEIGDIIDDNGDGVPFVDYYDDRWDVLLDQMKASEITKVFSNGAFKIERIPSLNTAQVNCADGPVGWTCFLNKSVFYKTCKYVSQVTAGATWNEDLLYEFGQMVGDEGLVGDAKTGMPYSGWYAPGVNIHRSAFGGRNFEYFSEDPLLSGKLASAQIRGVQSKGVFAFVKHFALNEQETHRSISGDCSWVTEQAMREIFLRPFEIAVKEGGTRAMMSSFNRIGTRWTGGDYRLLTEILRVEWGFNGIVISDFNTIPEYMDAKQMAYAGGDLNLATLPDESWYDTSSIGDMTVLRKSMHNICYTIVNSNAMNKVVTGYKLPVWVAAMIAVDAVAAVGLGLWGYFAIRRFLNNKGGKEAASVE